MNHHSREKIFVIEPVPAEMDSILTALETAGYELLVIVSLLSVAA